MFKLITKNVNDKIDSKSIRRYQVTIDNLIKHINLKTLDGCDMMGWMELVDSYDSRELVAMRNKAKDWQKLNVKYVLVIGIGGSYVGVRAAIDMCCGVYDKQKPTVLWLHNMSSSYVCALKNKLMNEKFAIIVISKSGTTLEPAVGFRIFRDLLTKNVGVTKVNKYIVAVTDKEKGTLHEYAKNHHITMFGIPDNIGGRFSTLTPVGMFLMILKGLNPLEILNGAKQAQKDCQDNDILNNSAYLYACLRHHFYTTKHLQIENFVVYDPSLQFVGEMWRQIYGESEGKNNRGLYPSLSLFTTDLHSMGQYLQQGTRNFFETTLWVQNPVLDMKLKVNDNDDKIKYLNNKSLHFINEKAFEGTIQAHTKIGKVNNIILKITKNDEFHFGYLFMWFAIAVTISGYLLKVNPFDQPGVEQYKSNMFKLLGKKK